MISKDSIENLKSLIDIVDVIGNYVQLKKAGSNYKGLCPFHSEKTPSFVVSPAKQIYHCFGCHASGDAIKFVMEIEKLNYKEAIEKLAGMYNFKLEYTSNAGFLSINLLEKVNSFYKGELAKNKTAYEYLKQRGLYDSTIAKFGLGYAPNASLQMRFFQNASLNKSELTKLGVLVESGEYPRLIERITFPIFSQSGKIIAFGGRTITNHPAKYINFTNTKIFNKSRTFYGLNFAREHILRKKEVIITEGYMDVIMLHQAGIQNSVATLGTAMTPMHLPILKKINPKVIVAYDSDTAGINAALKASKLLFKDFFEGGVVLFEEGTDPADAVKENKNVTEYFKSPIPFEDFITEHTLKKYDLKNPVQKKEAVNELKEYISTLDEILKENFAQNCARVLQISPSLLLSYSKSFQNAAQVLKKIDIAEAGIIKTLYENEEWIDSIIEYLDPALFDTHSRELQSLFSGDTDNPQLYEIILREDIKTLDYETLKKQIANVQRRYLSKQMNLVKYEKNIDHLKRLDLLKKYNTKLNELKKGVPIELKSDSII